MVSSHVDHLSGLYAAKRGFYRAASNIPVIALNKLSDEIQWNNVLWSCVFDIVFGVRQGSVLSPFLFALYIDDLGKLCNSQTGCFIILYADDILLISLSVVYLEQLLHACERELKWLDMSINLVSHVVCALVREVIL